jgi:hypothetical protein
MLDDKIFLRGLGTHAPSTVTYRIPAGATEFRAVLGINQCTNGQGSADASVRLDGKIAYEAPTVRGGGQPIDVRVPLGDASYITLRSTEADNGLTCDHVDWALARFVFDLTPDAESNSSTVTVVPTPGAD